MSKIVFRNNDKKAVVKLIREMGKERYECALKDAELIGEFRPKRTLDFFFEWDNGISYLCHKYPMCQKKRLLNVNGFWAIPKEDREIYYLALRKHILELQAKGEL